MESANCWGVDRIFNPSSNPSRIPSVEWITVSPLNIVCIDAVKAANRSGLSMGYLEYCLNFRVRTTDCSPSRLGNSFAERYLIPSKLEVRKPD